MHPLTSLMTRAGVVNNKNLLASLDHKLLALTKGKILILLDSLPSEVVWSALIVPSAICLDTTKTKVAQQDKA